MEAIDVRVELAPDPDLTAAPSTWAWQDVTPDWATSSDDVAQSVGADDEQAVGRSSLGLVLRNGTSATEGAGAGVVGRYTEDNPQSDLWPGCTLGCGLRLSLNWGDGWTVVAAQTLDRLEYEWVDGSGRLPLAYLQASGPLTRLAAGSVVASALRRAVTGAAVPPLAWWSLEHGDDRETLTVPSDLVGGVVLTAEPASAGTHRASGVVGGAITGPPGADKAVNLTAGGQLSSALPAATPGDPWRYELGVLVAHALGEFDNGQIFRLGLPDGTLIGVFATVIVAVELVISISGPGGFESASTPIPMDDGVWRWVSLTCEDDGGDLAYSVRVAGAEVLAGTAVGVPFDAPTSHAISPTGDLDAASSAVYWSAASLPADDLYAASIAHAGEMAHERIARLCTEDSVPYSVTATTSATMGPQQALALVPLLRECERTDRGILSDHLGVIAYRALSQMHNTDPVLQLDGSADEIFSPYRPVVDDQRVRDATTASRPGGGSVTVADGATPTHAGSIYPNASADNLLPHHAQWRNNEGQIGARYPSLAVHLHTRPALIAATMAVILGDVIEVTHPPRGHAQLPRILQTRGYTWTLRGTRGPWIWRANTISALPYEVYEVETGSGNRSRIPAGVSTTDAEYAGAVTSLSVTSAVTRWIDSATYPSQFPIRITVAGERMTLTAVTGTGLTQTFSVTRGLDGWTKTLPAGSAVQLDRAPVLAL